MQVEETTPATQPPPSLVTATTTWLNDKSDLDSLDSDYFKNSLHQPSLVKLTGGEYPNSVDSKKQTNKFQVLEIEVHNQNIRHRTTIETSSADIQSTEHYASSTVQEDSTATGSVSSQFEEIILSASATKDTSDNTNSSEANINYNTLTLTRHQVNSGFGDSEGEGTYERRLRFREDRKSVVSYDSIYLSSEGSNDESTIVDVNEGLEDPLPEIRIRSDGELIQVDLTQETHQEAKVNVDSLYSQIKKTKPKILSLEPKPNLTSFSDTSTRGTLERLTFISSTAQQKEFQQIEGKLFSTESFAVVDNQYCSLPDASIGISLRASERIDAKLRLSCNNSGNKAEIIEGEESNSIICDSISKFGKAHKRLRQREKCEIVVLNPISIDEQPKEAPSIEVTQPIKQAKEKTVLPTTISLGKKQVIVDELAAKAIKTTKEVEAKRAQPITKNISKTLLRGKCVPEIIVTDIHNNVVKQSEHDDAVKRQETQKDKNKVGPKEDSTVKKTFKQSDGIKRQESPKEKKAICPKEESILKKTFQTSTYVSRNLVSKPIPVKIQEKVAKPTNSTGHYKKPTQQTKSEIVKPKDPIASISIKPEEKIKTQENIFKLKDQEKLTKKSPPKPKRSLTDLTPESYKLRKVNLTPLTPITSNRIELPKLKPIPVPPPPPPPPPPLPPAVPASKPPEKKQIKSKTIITATPNQSEALRNEFKANLTDTLKKRIAHSRSLFSSGGEVTTYNARPIRISSVDNIAKLNDTYEIHPSLAYKIKFKDQRVIEKMSRPQILNVVDTKRNSSNVCSVAPRLGSISSEQDSKDSKSALASAEVQNEFQEKVDAVRCYWSKFTDQKDQVGLDEVDKSFDVAAAVKTNDCVRNFVTSLEQQQQPQHQPVCSSDRKSFVRDNDEAPVTSFSPMVEIIELDGNKHAAVVNAQNIEDQDFDHIRYKVMKSDTFQKNIMAQSRKEAQFDGLLQYLHNYSFQVSNIGARHKAQILKMNSNSRYL